MPSPWVTKMVRELASLDRQVPPTCSNGCGSLLTVNDSGSVCRQCRLSARMDGAVAGKRWTK